MCTFVSGYFLLIPYFTLAKFIKMQYIDIKMCFNICQTNVDINNPV